MKILKNIEIKNYRGIKDLFFEPNSINVIVGPNNTGKSAILEAIGLLLSFQNKFEDSLGSNIAGYLFETKEYVPSYLIHLYEKFAKIRANIKEKEYNITIEYYSEGIPHDERSDLITEYFDRYVNTIYNEYIEREGLKINRIVEVILQELKESMNLESSQIDALEKRIKDKVFWKFPRSRRYLESERLTADMFEELRNDVLSQVYSSPKLVITAYTGNELSGLYLFLKNPIEMRKIETEPFFGALSKIRLYIEAWEEMHKIVPFADDLKEIPLVFNFQKSTFVSSIEKLHDLVVREGKIERAVELLKERNIIENIRKTEEGLVVFTKQHDKPLPLSSMGDGFLALLRLIFLTAIAEKGIILLEEPEISLHPGYLNIIAEELVLNSEIVQFFISTHSLDLLLLLLEKAEERQKLDKINVIRLHYRDATKQIHPEVVKGTEAKEEIDEIGTDLRLT